MGQLAYTAIKDFMHLFFPAQMNPDFASSTIAKHYEEYGPKFWEQPVEERSIEQLAIKETAWWRTQHGWAYIIGGGTPECLREAWLNRTWDKLKANQPKK